MESFGSTSQDEQFNFMNSSTDSPETKLSYLHQLAAGANSRIARELCLLARIRHNINQIQSPIYTLPPEVLSLIFLFLCPIDPARLDVTRDSMRKWDSFSPNVGDTNKSAAILLSHVSSYWRQVAFATPGIWSFVHISEQPIIMTPGRESDSAIALLRHHVQKAIFLDISICLPQDLVWEARVTEIGRILFGAENVQRIRTLRVGSLPPDYIPLSKLSQIQTLCVSSWTSDDPFTEAILPLDLFSPSLGRFALSGDRWSEVKVPDSLQELSLINTMPTIDLAVLKQCLNLIQCHMSGPICCDEDERFYGQGFDISCVYQSLVSFTWSVGRGINDGSAYRNVSLPVLKHLHLIASEYVEQGDTVIHFIQKHSNTLVSLRLDNFIEWGDGDCYDRLFQHDMPHIRMVAVGEVEFKGVTPCIRALMPDSEDRPAGRVFPFPNLEVFKIVDFQAWGDNADNDKREISAELLRMLQLRRAGKHTAFHVNISGFGAESQEVAWPLTMKEDFRNSFAGHQVTLTFDSETPTWLLNN